MGVQRQPGPQICFEKKQSYPTPTPAATSACTTTFLISPFLEAFFRRNIISVKHTLEIETQKAMPVNFLFGSGMILTTVLVALKDRCRDGVLGSPVVITVQFPREAVCSLLGGSDSLDQGHHPLMLVMSCSGQPW